MALNDEQLQTQTRLTILQNHQLTTELDYQNKNTEALVVKNDQMTKQIETLKRNISLHKNIEKQLAKRAYKSQKIIAQLKAQAQQLESEKTAKELARTNQSSPNKSGGMGTGANSLYAGNQNNLDGEELIDFLEQKLEGIERKLAGSQADYEFLQSQCLQIQDKLSLQKEKYKRAALMLSEFLEDLLSQKPNILRSSIAQNSSNNLQ